MRKSHSFGIDSSGNKIQLNDLRAYKGNKPPSAPKYKEKSYSAFGDKATQSGFKPSAFNKEQMTWTQLVMPQIQNKLFDSQGADNQARAYADNLKSQGLKSFKRDTDELFGGYQADSARRFGSLDNSTFDSNMKRFGQATQEGLQELNNNYDVNYQNALNNYQQYYTNMLNVPQTIQGNLYNLANGQSQNALGSSNAVNGFNQNNYQQQVAMYNQKLQADAMKKAAMYQAAGAAIGGGLSGGGTSALMAAL